MEVRRVWDVISRDPKGRVFTETESSRSNFGGSVALDSAVGVDAVTLRFCGDTDLVDGRGVRGDSVIWVGGTLG
jgi:hypothetical protein